MSTRPRELRPQATTDTRPDWEFQRYHDWARTHKPRLVYELVRLFVSPLSFLWFRLDAWNRQNVPRTGAAILAPTHHSNMDHFFVATYLLRRVRFMAKSQMFSRGFGWFFCKGGVFPVLRGKRDEAAFITANTLLAQGDRVIMYPSGGRHRGPGKPTAKYGIGKLALQSGQPVIPAGIVGSDKTRNWWQPPAKVIVNYGRPMQYERVAEPTREQSQRVANEIMAEIIRLEDQVKLNRLHGCNPVKGQAFVRFCSYLLILGVLAWIIT